MARKQLAHLNRIRASANHLLGLIDEVLTFSRVEAGKEVVHPEDVSLRSIVNEAITMIAPIAEAKGLSVRAHGDEVRLLTDGLSVSRTLARLVGGDIRVESELGKGSSFILTLPVGRP